MMRQILIRTGIIIITVVLGVVYIILSPLDYKRKISDLLMRLWAAMLLFISGVKTKITGLENIDKKNSYIVVSNHQSQFDIPVMIRYLPLTVRMLAKKELFRIPIFGWAMYLAGHISLDRGKGKKALKSLKEASEKIRKMKLSIIVYPEGTRSPDGKVQNFKKGAFRLGLETRLPVLPVSIIGSREIMPKDSLIINKGEIKIIVGNPIITENLEKAELKNLSDTVRNEIIKNMEVKN
ncbi:lysophospholipid acyltransferase family protein [candidate division KSB1 bacterium]